MSEKKTKEVYPAIPIQERTACPAHPGEVLKGLYLDELNITLADFARQIGVSRKAVSMIANQHKSVTPEMALRFAKALATTPELWLDMQRNYDLWQAAHPRPGFLDAIKPIKAAML